MQRLKEQESSGLKKSVGEFTVDRDHVNAELPAMVHLRCQSHEVRGEVAEACG